MINLINGDCLEVMDRLIKDGVKVDAIITDPPYKTISGGVSIKDGQIVSDGTNCSNKWLKKDEGSIPVTLKNGTQFEYNNINFYEWIPKLQHLCNDRCHVYIMSNDRNVQNILNEASKNNLKLLNILVWEKNNCTPNKYYMKSCEFILLFRFGGAKSINNMGTKTILKIDNIIGNKIHPSEKPLELLEILIRNSSNKNQTILDPFMGSGSTGVACKNLNRKFIGIEIDKKYFNISNDRINNIEKKQKTIMNEYF